MTYRKLASVILACLSAIVCLILSLLLTGGGHGWYGAVRVSWLALGLAPATMLLPLLSSRSKRIGLAIGLLAAALIANFVLIRFCCASTTNSAAYAATYVPLMFSIWLITWIYWQALLAWHLISALRE